MVLPQWPFDVPVGVCGNNSVTNPNTFQDASVGVLISVLRQLIVAAVQLVKSDTLQSSSTVTEPMNQLLPTFLGLSFVGECSVPRPTIPELEFVEMILERCHRIGRLLWPQDCSQLFLRLSLLFESGLLESPDRSCRPHHLSQNGARLLTAKRAILLPVSLNTFLPKLIQSRAL